LVNLFYTLFPHPNNIQVKNKRITKKESRERLVSLPAAVFSSYVE
jgi:hypothetical protein